MCGLTQNHVKPNEKMFSTKLIQLENRVKQNWQVQNLHG